jgi:hypothetical protein
LVTLAPLLPLLHSKLSPTAASMRWAWVLVPALNIRGRRGVTGDVAAPKASLADATPPGDDDTLASEPASAVLLGVIAEARAPCIRRRGVDVAEESRALLGCG